MGATTWHYFAPYDSDASAALQRLREHIFREDNYERFTFSADELESSEDKLGRVDPSASLEQLRMQESETFFQWLARLEKLDEETSKPKADYSRKPATIDELLEEQGESGTHSILDIQRVSDEPEIGAVTPMPFEELQELFGTGEPTRKMIEDKLGDYDLVEHPLVSQRWQGVYLAVYRDGKPAELFFIGTSGD